MISVHFSMIDYKSRFIFFHIPKTGGTSIGNALFGKAYRHLADFTVSTVPVDLDMFFKFCFVRNPWDRTVSQYLQIKKPVNLEDPRRKSMYEMANKYSFINWMRLVVDKDPLIITEGSFTKKLCDPSGRMRADFIGRFENLETDFYELCLRLNLKKKALLRLNVSKRNPYNYYYDDFSRGLVEELFENELRLFDYKF